MLAAVPGFELTEVHRQAKDSKIIQLAYAARYGEKFWESIPYAKGEVEEYLGVEASAFLTSPLIVWRNIPRVECTLAIRKALGYPPDALVVGEPLVCRASDARSRAEGYYNNAMFRVVPPSVVVQSQDNPRLVTVQQDGNPEAETQDVLVHLEELHGDNIDPEAVLFRFGYALTAHTAQGGEWPTVYISKPELGAHTRKATKDDNTEAAMTEFRQWAYTAITRAKTTLGFVRKHDFTATTPVAPVPWVLPHIGDEMPKMQQQPTDKIAPPSAPMLSRDPHEPDDIPEPTLPPGLADEAMASAVPGLAPDLLGVLAQAHAQAQIPPAAARTAQEPSNGVTPPLVPSTVPPLPDAFLPLAHGFCQYLQAQFGAKLAETAIGMTKEVSATIDGMTRYAQGVLQSNEHVGYQLSDALLKVQEHGLTIHSSPYEMSLQVYTPAGVPLALTIRKTSPGDLLDELTRLETWLARHGYTGEKPAGLGAEA